MQPCTFQFTLKPLTVGIHRIKYLNKYKKKNAKETEAKLSLQSKMTETVCVFCTTKNKQVGLHQPHFSFSFLHQVLLFQSNLLNTEPQTNETKPGNILKENKGKIYRFTHILTTLSQALTLKTYEQVRSG